jgi:ABC-type transport system involved in multi-copper enzyme maturation permease subunit
MAVSFLYPATTIARGGLGLEHLAAVFLGLTLHGVGVASIGLVCSAFTSSQLVAAVSAWAVAFLFWDFSWANSLVSERVAALLDALSMQPRYSSFAGGIVSLANVAYFAGIGLVCLALARFSFDLRRVSG